LHTDLNSRALRSKCQHHHSLKTSFPAMANIDRSPTSYVLEEVAPVLGLAFLPSIIHVFEDVAPLFGFNSFPSQTHVLDDEAFALGLISLPLITQVLAEVAPLFGFSSRPSQTQLLGKSMFKLMASLSLVKIRHSEDVKIA
jgi:hypothetical protein